MARRLNGEGLLRRRSDNRWELRVMLGYRDDGKPKHKYFYGRTKKEVSEKFAKFQKERNGGIDFDHNYTFSEWSEIWFEHHKPRISPTTQEHYRFILKRLVAGLGEKNLKEIKAIDIESFLQSEKDEEYSDSHLSSCRGLLYQIFHKAEANDIILKNPVRFAEKMRSSNPNKRKDAFTAKEVQLMMDQLPHDPIGWSIRLLLGTGMRTQELLALEPHHIDKDGSVIRVYQAVQLVKGTVHVGDTKTATSYREIPVPPNLQWCAKNLRNVDTKFIFERGKKDFPCNPSYYRNKFKAAISQIEGVRTLTPHSCRHTYVSQMQALGIDMETIKSIVGHADIDMTEHYLHVQESIRKEAVRKFSEAFPQEDGGSNEPDPGRSNILPFPNVG